MKTYLVQFTGLKPSIALLADSLAGAVSIATRRYMADIASVELL